MHRDTLELKGLMCIPAADAEQSKQAFIRLQKLATRLQFDSGSAELSMGMSQDYPEAIKHGALWIRVGTAIFGPRT
jgi:hypothetical protein